jgi:hypothetical protein
MTSKREDRSRDTSPFLQEQKINFAQFQGLRVSCKKSEDSQPVA